MMWIQPVDTLDLVVRGLIVGVVASAPMGPVGVLCVQRTLNKGRWYGFVTGVGAAVSD
ncbi:MAG: LysE family translocator, partial [Prevotellaceae bacterium]|nr:LysE family translocator [Prevotellaceae bacterium]